MSVLSLPSVPPRPKDAPLPGPPLRDRPRHRPLALDDQPHRHRLRGSVSITLRVKSLSTRSVTTTNRNPPDLPEDDAPPDYVATNLRRCPGCGGMVYQWPCLRAACGTALSRDQTWSRSTAAASPARTSPATPHSGSKLLPAKNPDDPSTNDQYPQSQIPIQNPQSAVASLPTSTKSSSNAKPNPSSASCSSASAAKASRSACSCCEAVAGSQAWSRRSAQRDAPCRNSAWVSSVLQPPNTCDHVACRQAARALASEEQDNCEHERTKHRRPSVGRNGRKSRR